MLEEYLNEHETVTKQKKLKKEEKQIEEMDPELKEIAEKAKEDHEKGDLDKAAYESLLSGLVHGGKDFAAKLVESKFSDEISKTAATGLVTWWKQNTTYFVDRGLTLSLDRKSTRLNSSHVANSYA